MFDRLNFRMGRLALLAGAGLAAGLVLQGASVLAQAGKEGDAKAPARPPVSVEAQAVAVRAVEAEVKAVGSLRANESVMIRPEIAGRITEFLFHEGAKVEKGDLLVRLDASAYQAEVTQAAAALELSRRNFERAQELFRRDAASSRSLDEAQAKLESDRAYLELARTKRAKTEIRAPFSGIVGLRLVSVGAYVSPGQDIADLVSADPIKVDFAIPERHLPAVRVGQRLGVEVDAFPGESFAGEVYAISPQVDQQGRSLALRATVANASGRLRPGLFARVRLVTETRANAIVIAEQAVFAQAGSWFVFKVVDGKARITRIEAGIRRDGQVEITAGLAAGDVVVTAGQLKLRDGAPVQTSGGNPGQAPNS